MGKSLRNSLAARMALLVLAVICLVSLSANFWIGRAFTRYIERHQAEKAAGLVQNLQVYYDAHREGWDTEYVHGLGMYALSEGYILKLYDVNQRSVWDAERHDMRYCHQIMEEISSRMEARRPELSGGFESHSFELTSQGQQIGVAEISYYGPYALDEGDFQFLEALNHVLLGVAVVSLAAAVLLGFALAGGITRPIAEMASLAERIARGEWSARCQIKPRAAELCELKNALNDMGAVLEQQDELRKRMLSDISHELRTPVANVSSYLEAMEEGLWEPSTERLGHCRRELARLSELIADLEKLRQLESEIFRPERAYFSVNQMLRRVMDSFQAQLEEKGLSARLQAETELELFGDERRLTQVVSNLVSNAIKFSEQGELVLTLQTQQHRAVLIVEDEGIGVPEAELPLIFERFYRTERSRNRKYGGAGIGLAIARSIVLAHGGSIHAENRPGGGTRFVVTLPLEE